MDAVEVNTSELPQNDNGLVSEMEICRVCLVANPMLRDLFHDDEAASLSDKAMSFTSVKMLPNDGLPSKICCDCADKLESAYDFKLQVEHADNVLRERFNSFNIKAELFFNDDLSSHRDSVVQIHTPFVRTAVSLSDHTKDDESSLLKHALMQVETAQEQDVIVQAQSLYKMGRTCDAESEVVQHIQHQQYKNLQNNFKMQQIHEANISNIQQQQILQMSNETQMRENSKIKSNQEITKIVCIQKENETHHLQEIRINQMQMEETTQNMSKESIHGFQGKQTSQIQYTQEEAIQGIIRNKAQYNEKIEKNMDRTLSEDQEYALEEEQDESTGKETFSTVQNSYISDVTDIKFEESKENIINESMSLQKTETKSEQESPNEMRRSKRNLIKKCVNTDRDSDEENYFENLNLSSRLKKVQAEKSEKVFYMCYLCDKQFLSKGVLKEHMHSHEEVRKTLLLTRKPQTKMPSSGRKLNKCPYCGKEYLYVNSYTKHLKQHEKEKCNIKQNSFSSEIKDDTLGFEDFENSQSSYGGDGMQDGFDTSDENNENEDVEHEKFKHSQAVKTDKYLEQVDTKQEIQKHCIKHDSLKCSICDKDFETMENLKDHRSIHVMHGVLTDQDINDAQEQSNIIVTRENNEFTDEKQNIKIQQTSVDDEVEETKNSGADQDSSKLNDLKCPHCPMTCTQKNTLSRHLETHRGFKYVCKICHQQFTRKDQFRRHNEQHGKIKSFKCTQCNKTFGNELTLRNHLIATNHKTMIHGHEYDPNKRLKRVAAKAAQKIIDKIRTEDGLDECDDDDSEYDRKSQKEVVNDNEIFTSVPRKPHQNRQLICITCNKKCVSKQVLAKHMEQHEKNIKQEKVDLEKLKPVIEKYEVGDNDPNDDDDFEGGLDWPMDSHECTTCRKRYSTKKSLLRHQLLHEDPNFECDICNVKFYRKDKLKAHYDKCSEKNPDQVRKCNICGDSFENNDILREHRARHVTEGILTEEDLKEIEPCSEEKKVTEKIPRKRRTDIVGLECTECNKQYTSRKGLLRHIQVHEGKKYLCDICPKKFYRREHLKIHVAKHNMIKPYKCNRCTKRFIKEEQLTNHLTKHDRAFKKTKDADTSKRFLCEVCSKSFTQSTTLVAHLRAHNGIKPYVCEVCSRPFTTNAYLKMHMRTHTQERPYICQYCSRAFARADTLANHLTSHTGEAKYHCKYCPKNFRRLKSLKEHVFIHTGQRPYACPTCDRRFNNNGSRYAHSKRCKQNLVQNQTRTQTAQQTLIQQPQQSQQEQQHQQTQLQQTQLQHVQMHQRLQQTMSQAQILKPQNIKTITITRPSDSMTQQVLQHQEIIMPLILPLTVTLTDVGDEVILPESAKIFTTT